MQRVHQDIRHVVGNVLPVPLDRFWELIANVTSNAGLQPPTVQVGDVVEAIAQVVLPGVSLELIATAIYPVGHQGNIVDLTVPAVTEIV